MNMSPARAHRARMIAAQAAAVSPAGGPVQGGEYELMQAQLHEHRRALKSIQSVERKIEAKREFLPLYRAWVDAALNNGNGAHDMVLMTVLVWHIDAGDFDRALQIAAYAIAHDLPLPDQYDRNLATVLIDEIGGAALSGRMPVAVAVRVLAEVCHLTERHDAPDQARAKLHKALAYALMGRSGLSEVDVGQLPMPAAKAALNHCRRAFDLFEQVGVKKDIERLERRLKAAGTTDA